MSVGGISGSRYESMRAQFESFRSGSSRLQKADLEELKTALTSEGVADEKATSGIDELISKFSEIDTNGDGISTDELETAAQSGAITMKKPQGGPPPGGMKGPPPGPPPGGMGGPGGAQGTEGEQQGVAQSDLMGYDLFEEFKKKLQEQSDLTTQNTESTDASASTEETLLDVLSQMSSSSESEFEDSSDLSSSKSNAQSLAKMLNQQIMAAYGRNSFSQQFDVSSILGGGITV